MTRAHVRVGVVVGGVTLIDQVTKASAPSTHLPSLATAHNPGLLLGMLRGPAPVLVAAGVGVIVVFVAVVGRIAVALGVSSLIPALIAGGMLGNTLDRARLGRVRDFLHTPLAIINLADVAVALGLIALVVAIGRRVWILRRQPHAMTLDPGTVRAGRRARAATRLRAG